MGEPVYEMWPNQEAFCGCVIKKRATFTYHLSIEHAQAQADTDCGMCGGTGLGEPPHYKFPTSTQHWSQAGQVELFDPRSMTWEVIAPQRLRWVPTP